MSKTKSQAVPVPMLITSDVFGLLLSVLPVSLNYLGLFYIGRILYPEPLFIPFVLLSPWIASASFCLLMFLLRLTFPKMRAGHFRVGFNAGFVAWSLNFYLNRAVTLSGLKNFIFSSNVLRFFYLRAMGGDFPFQMNGSMGLKLGDLPMIKLGKGSTLGEGVMISAHTFTGSSLIISPVSVGENVFLGLDVVIGPGVQIGADSWIGSKNAFIKSVIPPQSFFPNGAWPQGDPEQLEKSQVRFGASSKSEPSA